MKINANGMDAKTMNEQIRRSEDKTVEIDGCMGHRYIACGASDREFTVRGVAGNALGAYLNGAQVTVFGNAQDAVGDTMNDGTVVIHGSSGDATGYAMRGGRIFVRDGAGYRAGIHMKSYREKVPALVIGGTAGDFLGEYQAGGVIVVLALGATGAAVGRYCGTGMHGGKIFLRGEAPADLPPQVKAREASEEDLAEIRPLLETFSALFGTDKAAMTGKFTLLTPNTANPYRRMYVEN